MSAFMVSRAHIDALVDVALWGPKEAKQWDPCGYYHKHQWTRFSLTDPDTLGQMLARENARSIRWSYEDADATGRIPPWADEGYRHNGMGKRPDVVEALKLVHCFEYQSCETKDWEETGAYAFCASLKGDLIRALPGYDEAPWEWEWKAPDEP